MTRDLPRQLTSEAIGTLLLVATVVGSGIMADRLTDDTALALLCNALATGAMLVVIITLLGPVSGAQFNPAVTLVLFLRKTVDARTATLTVAAQICGGIAGTLLAHAMFGVPFWQVSETTRTGHAQWLSEAVATFGLLFTIVAGSRTGAKALPWLVGLYITAAYWFTASTSFANPAVTIARALSNSFAGISPSDVPAFVVAQCAGAIAGAALARWLFATIPEKAPT